MCDMCQDNTGGVSGRYRSVERQCRSGSTMTHGVTCAQMCGHVKADDNDAQAQMSGHVNSVGQVTDAGGGLSGCRSCLEWLTDLGKQVSGHGIAWRRVSLGMSSARCNRECKLLHTVSLLVIVSS